MTLAAQSAPRPFSSRQIIGYVYFTFIVYLSVGLPLAVLPAVVHLRMGYAAVIAGFIVSVQFVATLASRPLAGRISDRVGAKVAVEWGMMACTLSGVLVVLSAWAMSRPILALATLVMSRLALGLGESLGSTGATLWAISAVGQEHTAQVIGYNGIATYGAQALGAPVGVLLEQQFGLHALGALIAVLAGSSLLLALRKQAVAVTHQGEHLPMAHVALRVAPHGIALALGGVGYGVIATFVTLFFFSRHWPGAALCLTAFGGAFVIARIFLIPTIRIYGGFAVGLACLSVESVGLLLLWRAGSPQMALAAAAITGFGFSLCFPALGVEAVRSIPPHNRGTALGVYTAFVDVSLFLVGPVAGLMIGAWGYSSVFLFGLICALVALVIVVVLHRRDAAEEV